MRILPAVVVVSLFLLSAQTSKADEQSSWEQPLGSDYSWSQITAAGTLLISTEKSLLNIDPAEGKILWHLLP